MGDASELPAVWTGVDAQEYHGGECPIDWSLIDDAMAEAKGDHILAYNLLTNSALMARDEGNLELCSYMACHALVAFNYGPDYINGFPLPSTDDK